MKRGKASTGRTKRSTPMSVVHVADVRGSSVGLHPNQFLEADLPCPWLRACRARSMGASIKGLLRRRHTPAGHRELASVGALVRDPHRIIGRSLSALRFEHRGVFTVILLWSQVPGEHRFKHSVIDHWQNDDLIHPRDTRQRCRNRHIVFQIFANRRHAGCPGATD